MITFVEWIILQEARNIVNDADDYTINRVKIGIKTNRSTLVVLKRENGWQLGGTTDSLAHQVTAVILFPTVYANKISAVQDGIHSFGKTPIMVRG